MTQGGGITPTVPGTAKPSAPAGQVVQIQSLPDALRTVSRALRVEGEVVAQNRDGSVRIRTPQGDMDVVVRGRQPQPGQRMEVELPAGSPPRTATLRPAQQTPAQPQPTQPPSPATPPAQGQTPPAPTAPPPQMPGTKPAPLPPATTPPPAQKDGTTQPSTPLPSSSPLSTGGKAAPASFPATLPQPFPASAATGAKPQTPLPGSYQPSAQALGKAGNIALPLPALSAGQTVRLTPLPPMQGPSLLPQAGAFQSSLLTARLGRLSLAADMAAQTVKTALSSMLIQTVKPALTPLPPVSVSLGPPVMQAGMAPTALMPPVPSALVTLSVLPGMAANPLDAFAPPATSLRPAPLDARIAEIRPFAVQFLTPGGKAAAGPMGQGSGNIMTARPSLIPATVTGFTPQNLPVISVSLPNLPLPQTFILQFAAGNLPQGSQILLSLPGNAAPVPAASGLPALKPVFPLMQPSSIWPVMDDLFQAFQTSPQILQSLARSLPSPANAANLGPAALLFIAAAKAGELQNWMGEKRLDLLQKLGKGSLLSRLSGETAPLVRPAGDSAGGDWRSYPIPLLWQNEISKVMLHLKHEPPEQGKPDQEGSTRFIFDLDLTRMGGVQLDGLLRGKRLDLIVRTQLPVSVPMQQAMKTAYADALDDTDIYGEITFQGDLKNWMNVLKRAETIGVSA